MLDSTARAERIDLVSSEAAYYTWEVAQKPVAVRLPLTLIDRLESEAVENFRSLTSRGSEIGGILLGTLASGNPSIVSVADFELIPCDYSRGPLYRLSDGDLGRFEQAIERHSSGAERVIGYFRSHTRKGVVLDAEDLAFFEPRFLEPQHIVLLIRPFAAKASTGGIFIRENGRISSETSYLEFPFRSSELVPGKNGGEKSESASQSGAPGGAAAQTAAAKSQSRAQIVPIASRREIALPEPAAPAAVPSPVPAPIISERAAAPVVQPAKPPAAAPPAEKTPEKAADKPAEKEKAVVPPPPAAVLPAEPAPAALAVASEEIATPAPAKNKKLRLTVAAAIGMLVLVGGSLVVYPMLRKGISSRSASSHQDLSPLALRAERTTGGMLLTWNRDLPAIQSASKVVLSITDGDRHENIQLDPNQVRTGNILYPPITGDVSFQMEVTDANQSKTTSESLRVLDPRPSPLADPATPDAAAKNTPAKPSTTPTGTPSTTASATPAAAESTPVAEPAEETPAPRSTVPLKPFNTQSLAQRLRPVAPTDLPDAPALARPSSATPSSLTGIVPAQSAVPVPPSPSSPAQAQFQSAPTGGQITSAQVISRVDPVYPRFAQQSGAGGIVELEATISVDGRVKNPHVTHGNVMLQKAAVDAVLQWRYKPAMLNGKPVESPVNIKLNFVQSH